MDESKLNYKVVHRGKYDKTTRGICGLKLLWIDIIPEVTKENINSLYAGSLVLKHLIAKYDGDVYKALKYYKGAERNLTPVNRTLKIYKELK